MKYTVAFLLLLGLLSVNFVTDLYNYKTKGSKNTCVTRAELEEIVESKKLQTLLQSYQGKQVYEIMIALDHTTDIYVIQYPSGGNPQKKYCINTASDTSINDESIDGLYQALEKVRGHRA